MDRAHGPDRGRLVRRDGRGDRPGPHRAGARRGGLRARPVARAADLQPGRRRRAVHPRGRALRGPHGLGGEPADHRAPEGARRARRGGVRSRTRTRTAGGARTRRCSGRPSSGSSRSTRRRGGGDAGTLREQALAALPDRAVDPALGRGAHHEHDRPPPRLDDLAPARLGRPDRRLLLRGLRHRSSSRRRSSSTSRRGWRRARAPTSGISGRPRSSCRAGTACGKCGGRAFRKETDILDVWFDSGCSHAAVLEQHAAAALAGGHVPRGLGPAPRVVPLLAARGRGHARAPALPGGPDARVRGRRRRAQDVEVRRATPWRPTTSSRSTARRSCGSGRPARTTRRTSGSRTRSSGQLAEAYRRVRNTCRFLLGNLADFDPATDAVPDRALTGLDGWAMLRLHRTIERVRKAYEAYEFHLAFQSLHNFCAVDLSALYLDVLKDRLYTSAANAPGRRAAQTACYRILDALVRLMAPILTFTAEEVWDHLRVAGQGAERPPHRLPGSRSGVALDEGFEKRLGDAAPGARRGREGARAGAGGQADRRRARRARDALRGRPGASRGRGAGRPRRSSGSF